MRLLLASKSQARRAMLEAAGVPFEVVEAELDEEAAKAGLHGAGFEPRDIAEELERADGSMLSKPESRAEAFDQLRSLSGATHFLHSAAVIAEGGEGIWWSCETVELAMRPLSDSFLEAYLDGEYEAIRWSVGGYRIEGPGVQLFERIEGSHFAILGLPLLPLLGYLRERGLLAS
jgi:septum formation protein